MTATDRPARVDAWGGAWEAVEDVPCQPCIWLSKKGICLGVKEGIGGPKGWLGGLTGELWQRATHRAGWWKVRVISRGS